jgi:hypothetical protein
MRSLRQLRLGGLSSSFAAGLTQLTCLSFRAYHSEPDLQRLANINGLTQLQRFNFPAASEYAGGAVKHICTTFTQLTSLALCGILPQGDIDMLLAHATHLLHLTVGRPQLSEDRSAYPCSWKELIVQDNNFDALTLGRLPLHSVTCLRFAGSELPSRCPALSLRAYCDKTQRVLTNLAACPAWSSSGPSIELHTGWGCDGPFCERHLQVLAAVRTSASKQVSKLYLSCVQQSRGASLLGTEVGTSLTHLHLSHRPLPDFWPAVWAHLPALQTLSIGGVFAEDVSREDLRTG